MNDRFIDNLRDILSHCLGHSLIPSPILSIAHLDWPLPWRNSMNRSRSTICVFSWSTSFSLTLAGFTICPIALSTACRSSSALHHTKQQHSTTWSTITMLQQAMHYNHFITMLQQAMHYNHFITMLQYAMHYNHFITMLQYAMHYNHFITMLQYAMHYNQLHHNVTVCNAL